MATPIRRYEGRGLTGEQLLTLPAVVDLDTANRALMLGRSTGYALAKRGTYPVRVLRLGNAYRVVTAELLRLLGVGAQAPDGVGCESAEAGVLPRSGTGS